MIMGMLQKLFKTFSYDSSPLFPNHNFVRIQCVYVCMYVNMYVFVCLYVHIVCM